MPQMGESVTEGTILEWHVEEGQEVSEGDTVVEVSTDKIDAEVPAPASGVVTKILAKPDDTVEVGQALAQIDPNGASASGNGAGAPGELSETADGLVMGGGEGDEDLGDDDVPSRVRPAGRRRRPRLPGRPDASAEEGGTLVVAMPEMGESVTEGTVLEWHVEEGQQVSEGDTVIEVSTDKIDAEVPAPASGTITKLLVSPDDTVQVGQALAEMTAGAGAIRRRRAAADASGRPGSRRTAAPAPDGRQRTRVPGRPPGRRRQGRRHRRVKGSGPSGKVTKEDVLAAADGKGTTAPPPRRRTAPRSRCADPRRCSRRR